jgi:glycosyltransferase involved in cell wall biosynthesis
VPGVRPGLCLKWTTRERGPSSPSPVPDLACSYIGSLADQHLVVGKDMYAQLEHAGCANIHFWDVGCDTDLFAPSRRSEAMDQDGLRHWMSGGRPGLGESGEGPLEVRVCQGGGVAGAADFGPPPGQHATYVQRPHLHLCSAPTFDLRARRAPPPPLPSPLADIIVYVGRVVAEKGLPLLPEVLDRLNGPKNEHVTTVVRPLRL